MKRKEIAILIRKQLTRWPTIVEINYYALTGDVKTQKWFSLEEKQRFNPNSTDLKEVYDFMKALLYVREHKDTILSRMRLDGVRQRAEEIRAEKKFRQFLNQYEKGIRSHSLGGIRRYRRAESMEVADQLRDNKRRIVTIVDYHIRHNTVPTAEMMYLINKYQ